MPTPFMHLQIAERIRDDHQLTKRTCHLITEELPAFYMGHVAPDFQWLAGLPRAETHFYELPPARDNQGYPRMLATYPELTHAQGLSAAQAVFVAAYCAHLMLDLLWYREVLVPFFIAAKGWSDHRHRFLAHNSLLTYLDLQAVDSLPGDMAATLASAEPHNWLPFAEDEDLVRWRDMLVDQLAPGGSLQTVEIFASRMSMPPEEFASLATRPEWLQDNVFSKVPLDAVQGIMDAAVPHSIELIDRYLNQ